MEGRASAPAAGTILNALATGIGSAFAIDRYVTATVTLHEDSSISGTVAGVDDADTRLIERCVELVTARYGDGQGGTVRTESEVPIAAGLKSSSAAANATVIATLSALDAVNELSREDAARLGVEAARDVGVTVTGAFDDASASMLGGVTLTDNETETLYQREQLPWDVLVWTPPEQVFSSDAPVDRCRRVAPLAELVEDLARESEYARAMTVNGFAFCGALEMSTEPLVEALPDATGVSLSGTGPSFTAVGSRADLERVQSRWASRPGATLLTETQSAGVHIDD